MRSPWSVPSEHRLPPAAQQKVPILTSPMAGGDGRQIRAQESSEHRAGSPRDSTALLDTPSVCKQRANPVCARPPHSSSEVKVCTHPSAPQSRSARVEYHSARRRLRSHAETGALGNRPPGSAARCSRSHVGWFHCRQASRRPVHGDSGRGRGDSGQPLGCQAAGARGPPDKAALWGGRESWNQTGPQHRGGTDRLCT